MLRLQDQGNVHFKKLYFQIFFFFFSSVLLRNAPVVRVLTGPFLSNKTSNSGSPSVYLQMTHISTETAATQRSPQKLSRKEDRDQYTNAVQDARDKYWSGMGFLERKQDFLCTYARTN